MTINWVKLLSLFLLFGLTWTAIAIAFHPLPDWAVPTATLFGCVYGFWITIISIRRRSVR